MGFRGPSVSPLQPTYAIFKRHGYIGPDWACANIAAGCAGCAGLLSSNLRNAQCDADAGRRRIFTLHGSETPSILELIQISPQRLSSVFPWLAIRVAITRLSTNSWEEDPFMSFRSAIVRFSVVVPVFCYLMADLDKGYSQTWTQIQLARRNPAAS